jgi:indolepyruvate ferredoxin oxidoreductase
MTSEPANSAAQPAHFTLQDKYKVASGRIYLTGIQALVRLPMVQKRRDIAAGRHTAGFVTGYRGSPLGTLDEQLVGAQEFLHAHDVQFMPGVNEDLAATAVWGSQQAEIGGNGRFDGVFAMWYAKGPGVDRSGDALRHGNLAGSSAHGGVLVLAGDDHTCESSTTCHQSEFALMDAQIPVLSPAGVQELLDFGILGWAMSRYSGCWIGLKCVKDTVESSASVLLDEAVPRIVVPDDATHPPDGLHIRQPDTPHAQEARLVNHKLDAARDFARVNQLDRVAFGARANARIGIVTAGKSWLDVRQALQTLGVDAGRAHALGLAVFKVGMVWPLEPQRIGEFARGLELVIVVEEKRSLLESQLKEILYGMPGAPRVIGKKDEQGQRLFPVEMALNAAMIARALADRLAGADASLHKALAQSERRKSVLPDVEPLTRSFYFCAGCPHNTSTRLPPGSQGYAGIGCSWMAQSMDRSTTGYTQMGAEGMSWVGEAPFSKRTHMFQNMGDGTYFHSGTLAVRAAVAAKTNITFKVLFNDAVAMTGGQRHDGPLDPQRIARQMHAEGVARIAVVADDPHKYPPGTAWPPGVSVHHRDALDDVQKLLRAVPGTSVLIYDQTCAAVKRRGRKRGTYAEPKEQLLINELVCEGCGDCGVQSNCVAIVPVETEFGRKRAIDQSACNKDYSCAKGFCPSFVTVTGGQLRRTVDADVLQGALGLPEPARVDVSARSCDIVVAGVGGTGVVTVGALLGVAAHLEGRGVGVLDMAGLAQKGGSVWTHVRVGASDADITSVRVPPGGADLIVGCDMVVAASAKTLALTRHAHTRVLLNTEEVFTGEFTRQPDMAFPANPLIGNIHRSVGAAQVELVAASQLARRLCGDAIGANLFLLGLASQRGLLPVAPASIEQSIALNGAMVALNTAAFRWGRLYAARPQDVESRALGTQQSPSHKTLEARIQERAEFLASYQDARYAQRYREFVGHTLQREQMLAPEKSQLTEAVAVNLFRLMAYKDEYEVARLFTGAPFRQQVEAAFEGKVSLRYHLAPPGLTKPQRDGQPPRKRQFGAWVYPVFKVLAALKFLRGSRLDPFGYSAERRLERNLIRQYTDVVQDALAHAVPTDYDLLLQICSAPQRVRGFGHVKHASLARYEESLLAHRQQWSARKEVSTQV